jgi:hypothetical protein
MTQVLNSREVLKFNFFKVVCPMAGGQYFEPFIDDFILSVSPLSSKKSHSLFSFPVCFFTLGILLIIFISDDTNSSGISIFNSLTYSLPGEQLNSIDVNRQIVYSHHRFCIYHLLLINDKISLDFQK